MTFNFEIYRETRNGRETHNGGGGQDGALLSAELVYVNADPSAMKATPLPDDLRKRILAYERVAPA
jgi:acyl-CoA thioesterase FadM